MSKRDKPMWIEPINESANSSLKVFNSLSNQKDVFKPREGNKVQWYSCGPTVYDVSHMGHARTYISIDIIRRIMRDYLKYDLNYVMNITDVDDKIIKRARQNYLFANYKSESLMDFNQVKEDLKSVIAYYENKIEKEKDADMKIMLVREKEGVSHLINQEYLDKCELDKIQDAMSTWLDSKYGHTVCDNSIFEDLPRTFEKMFMEDMKELNILFPDQLTRVSEYIPNIIMFVVKIIDRELAYESNGSVYFDTEKFDKQEDHYYAKLVPTAFGNESLLQEGEGALSSTEAGEKRSKNDFALWKASKLGEPSWDSPWGKGRPGWHIECSAMAGDKCGSHLDIHTGGVDLKFPHHDNEIAQSEAYFGCKQWVNYFLHTGHLTISGCKMSKSLKNFISIREALSRHTWRQLRFAFLLSSWKDTLDYSDDLMTAALVYEKMLLDFFFTVRHIINFKRDSSIANLETNELSEILANAKEQFHTAICDSFDTRGCMTVLKKLVEDTNKHCMEKRVLKSDVRGLREIAEYVCAIIRMFGASEEGDSLDLVQYSEDQLRSMVQKVLHLVQQFQENLRTSSDETNIVLIDKLYDDFLDRLKAQCNLSVDDIVSVDVRFSRTDVELVLQVVGMWRQDVRSLSRTNKWKKFLAACDDLRDNGMKEIGIRLHDTEEDVPSVGLYPVWAFEDKKAISKDKSATTQNKNLVGAAKVKLSVDVSPEVMFTQGPYQGQFSSYDDAGLPTHDASGIELSKNRRTKLKKLQDDQRKKYVAASL